MFSFDASALIYFWDNYPERHAYLKPLWNEWFASLVRDKTFAISEVAREQVKTDDLVAWMKRERVEFETYNILAEDAAAAQQIKDELGIVDDNYSKDGGVDENDILIIAVAKRTGTILVSDEAKQPESKLPSNKINYKIPAVCALESVGVRCINIAELLKREELYAKSA